jgi:hypothetical protein
MIPQRAISSRVRLQPRQTLVAGSSSQTLMQGEGMGSGNGFDLELGQILPYV